ncbi:MAG: DUF4129 domain-containing protein [Acidobacteria bacterium]|nr:DUF4129 domain-containing protein [Acidobacteriota bacterium]
MSQPLRFVPRARRPMEALDLGLGLLQAHWGPVYRVFFLQLGILLALILPFTGSQPAWALLWILWLTPWLDRGTLHVLSRRVFGQEAGVQTFLTQLGPIHRRGLMASLLWRRFSIARSYLLPVWQLEDQRGNAYTARARALQRQGAGTAFLLGLVSVVFAALTLFGILGLLQLLLPRGVTLDLWETLGQGFRQPWFNWLFTSFGLLAFALTEPFYAAAGFALYLNRRTQLEGWDLEQDFRSLAERLRKAGRTLLLLLALAGALSAQDPEAEGGVAAAPITAPEPTPSKPLEPLQPQHPARKQLEEILAKDPDLRRSRQDQVLRYRPTGREAPWLRRLLDALFGDSKPKDPASPTKPLDPAWWKVLAWVMKVVMVLGLVGLVVFLLVRFHAARLGRVKEGEAFEAPNAVAGLDVRPESLPPDVPAEALARFRGGDPRGALALLYRGALAALIHRHRLAIPASATEGDCLRASLPVLAPDPARAFRDLTTAWVRMAYLGEAPVDGDMAELCAQWRGAFGGIAP